jgi:hypothetical protein
MPFSPRAALLLLFFAAGSESHHVLELSLSRGVPPPASPSAASVLDRRTTYAEEIVNYLDGGGYYVQVSVGNPPQNLTMLLDTGSSDSWVLGYDADICNSPDLQAIHGTGPCVDTFDLSKSSTAHMIKRDGFRITYLDGRSASGHYISDDFSIGGATVRALQMAYVTRTVRATGILGLGFSISERTPTKYPNLMDAMFNQGSVGCKAYSLYLNDRRTDAGSILFGGVDTDKFIGPLDVLPLQRPPGSANFSSFEIEFHSVSLTFSNGTADLVLPTSILDHPVPAVLDSGTTLSYLPDKLAQPIFSAAGAVFDAALNLTLVDCVYADSSSNPTLQHVTFSFSSTTHIVVPLWSLILDVLPADYTPITSTPSPRMSKACVFGIQSAALLRRAGNNSSSNQSSSSSSSSSVNQGQQRHKRGQKKSAEAPYALLGDTFLRSAYVVYDLTHAQIGLAQANLNSTTSSVVELSADNPGLPKLTGVAAQQTTFTPTPSVTRSFGPTTPPAAAGSLHQNGAAGGSGGSLRWWGWGLSGEVVFVTFVTAFWIVVGGGAFCFV